MPQCHSCSLSVVRAVIFSVVLTAAAPGWGLSVDSVARYLPDDVALDPEIPVPRDVLGFEVGERHARPDQITAYLRALAAASPRVRFEEQGRTWEGRPQPLLTITSPDNHERLAAIRERHVALSDPATVDTLEPSIDRPVIVWLAYSIHGNEASGANASMVVAYYLAAATGVEMSALLRDTIVLIDPMQNPDGVARFAQWANAHRGRVVVGDPEHREHREPWPNGRTNHYWFDLNRDWLPVRHPESRNRVATFHRWRPNVVGDFHEMGSDRTYFFQPGVPTRWNPMTSARTRELTASLAEFHARALDEAGRLYYSGESFDDFYYGKGSTYPDLQGSVGILFEQASVRGHARETRNGLLTFPFAVENHVTTSLSTIEGAHAQRSELLEHQMEFARETSRLVAADPVAGWRCGAAGDAGRLLAFVDLLSQHQIEASWLADGVMIDGRRFGAGEAVAVRLDQSQYRLVKSLFERRVEFEDSTFYDVSTWTMPLAFGLTCEETDAAGLGEASAGGPPRAGRLHAVEAPVAFAFEWSDDRAAGLLYELQAAGAVARVATQAFTAETGTGAHRFGRGTIVVPAVQSKIERTPLAERIAAGAESSGLQVWALARGLATDGIDLGSPSMPVLEMPKPALIVGRGVSVYDAGAAWYLLDERMAIEVTLLELDRLPTAALDRYTHLLFVDGEYESVSESTRERITDWVELGGTIVATERAAVWAGSSLLVREDEEPEAEDDEAGAETADEPIPYGEYDARRAETLISGAIFEVGLDLTHPIAYGYSETGLPFFRTWTGVLPEPANPFEVVARYREEPLLSGYASESNRARIGGTPAVLATKRGEGTIIRFADDPSFRAYWYGTTGLYLNGLFFASVVQSTTAPADWP